MPRTIGWLAIRAHECDEHNVVERKRFLRRESAVRWTQVWMDYRWIPCFVGADLS